VFDTKFLAGSVADDVLERVEELDANLTVVLGQFEEIVAANHQ